MNILICDDIQADMAKLTRLLSNSGFDINIFNFCNGRDLLEYIRSGAVADACFLDIIMPDMDGVTLAEKLRGEGFSGEIVFLTSSNEYAAESYMVDAFSYLLKPATAENVQKILEKLIDVRRNSDTEGIIIKKSGITRLILFKDISHVEVIQHKIYFRLLNQSEIETNAKFADIAFKILHDRRFIQCHRSFIVNMNMISAIQGKEIIMRCGARIPISKSFSDVKKEYLKWVFRKSENKT